MLLSITFNVDTLDIILRRKPSITRFFFIPLCLFIHRNIFLKMKSHQSRLFFSSCHYGDDAALTFKLMKRCIQLNDHAKWFIELQHVPLRIITFHQSRSALRTLQSWECKSGALKVCTQMSSNDVTSSIDCPSKWALNQSVHDICTYRPNSFRNVFTGLSIENPDMSYHNHGPVLKLQRDLCVAGWMDKSLRGSIDAKPLFKQSSKTQNGLMNSG